MEQLGTDVIGNTRSITSKHRNYMLTVNNPSDLDYETIDNDDCVYSVYQLEKGENGTPHLQALICYKNPRVWPKKKYPTAHIEVARNVPDCARYCQKLETRIEGPWEKGEKPKQGERIDLMEAGDSILNGTKSINDIAIENPSLYIRCHKGLQALEYMKYKDREEAPIVMWLYGKSGKGKTSWVFKYHKDIYIKDETPWWDGYKQQEVILIDDFEGRMNFRNLLRLLDRYPYQGEYKGGYVKINSKYIYITSEYRPQDLYSDTALEQISRRLNKVMNF